MVPVVNKDSTSSGYNTAPPSFGLSIKVAPRVISSSSRPVNVTILAERPAAATALDSDVKNGSASKPSGCLNSISGSFVELSEIGTWAYNEASGGSRKNSLAASGFLLARRRRYSGSLSLIMSGLHLEAEVQRYGTVP